MEAQYAYTELDPGRSTFRILKLYPGKFEDDVLVQVTDLDPNADKIQTFTALSYTWGSDDRPEKVFVCSGELDDCGPPYPYIPATANLIQALRHIRKPEAALTLWVDAICINQDDLNERSAQVQLMPWIYFSAKHLVIWLGVERDDSALAILNFKRWSKVFTVDEARWNMKMRDPDDPDRWTAPPRFERRDYNAFKAFISRPWFERTWVQQELCHSSGKATIVCGNETIPWLEFYTAFVALYKLCSDVVEDTNGYLWWHNRWHVLAGLASLKSYGIDGLIDHLRKTKCSDNRDKVFGTLGMLRGDPYSRTIHDLRPDYTADAETVYRRFSQLCIEHHHSLHILYHCEPSCDPSLRPTWVADWSRPRTTLNTFFSQYADAYALMPCAAIRGEILSVEGIILDTVDVVRRFRVDGTSSIEPHTIQPALRTIHDTFLGCAAASEGRHVLPEILHVLLQDHVRDHFNGLVPDESVLDLNASERAFCSVINGVNPKDYCDTEDFWSSVEFLRYFIHVIYQNIQQRALVSTGNGRVGLTPFYTQSGDVVAVLLGLSQVVVLRPRADKTYDLVGASLVHGLNWGEGMLGPLPESLWRFEWRMDPNRVRSPTFRNLHSDELTVFDPRINWEDLRVSETDRLRDPRLSEEGKAHFKRPDAQYFLRHGVAFQTIDIA